LAFVGKHKRIGADEDKSFEPLLANIAEWLIDNPMPNWIKALIEAKNNIDQRMYSY